jgi:hypothetical protein
MPQGTIWAFVAFKQLSALIVLSCRGFLVKCSTLTANPVPASVHRTSDGGFSLQGPANDIVRSLISSRPWSICRVPQETLVSYHWYMRLVGPEKTRNLYQQTAPISQPKRADLQRAIGGVHTAPATSQIKVAKDRLVKHIAVRTPLPKCTKLHRKAPVRRCAG